MLSIDVLIVGGGLAGASLGYLLQKSELKCCIIDKAYFPREKLCGGLVTKKSHDLIGEIFGDTSYPRERTTNNVSLFLGSQAMSKIRSDSEFHLVDRLSFDHFFIKKFLGVEGVLIENTTISHLNTHENIAILSSGKEIRYKFLVGADGANSQIRKYVDSKYKPNAICLEFDSPASTIEDEIQVYFSAIDSGYAWCFPKKNHYTIGIGGDIKKNKDIKKLFCDFVKKIGKTAGKENATGALLPFGKYVKRPCRGNIILVGDAAGFVDPITGEGIYFAFLSAKYASESINDCIKSNMKLNRSYLLKVKHIQKIIDKANIFKAIFLNKTTRSFFLGLVDGKTHSTKYFCENLLAQYNVSYLDFPIAYLKARHRRKKSERKATL